MDNFESDDSKSDMKYDFDLWGDWTSVARAIVLVPLIGVSALCLIFSLLPVYLVLWSILPGHWLIPVAAYYIAGLFFFIPQVEDFMQTRFDKLAREPTSEEQQRLVPAWEDVISRVGKGADRQYRLRVMSSSDINAYAAGGRQVMVTQGSLASVSDSELRGIIAHELGHHAGLHPVLNLAARWIIKPINWAQWVAIKLHNCSAFFTRFARTSFAFKVLYIFAILLLIIHYLLNIIVDVSIAILQWLNRRAEYLADETAVELGFGPGLLSALCVFQEQELGVASDPSGIKSRLYATHPPLQKRIARVERALGTNAEG
ncbi:MAG: M48 family metalloprotease [bacterium]|nr:M48 family metalloprotease [bacterium]MCY4271308.1 M48 family metalloprotease [bacterium]